jgi:hypothetical protein
MHCELKTVDMLRERALNVLSLDSSSFYNSEDLQKFVVDTGYEGCELADKRTEQSLDLYVRNLGNSAKKGPSKKLPELNQRVFSELVKQNQVKTMSPEALARMYLEASEFRNEAFVSSGSDTNYISQLKSFSEGSNLNQTPSRFTLLSWLISTAEFINFLVTNYGGNIEDFTGSVRREFAIANNKPNFVDTLIKSFMPMHGLGHALAANFVKDLFATELNQNSHVSEQMECMSAWCLKPDMHVARLMLCITDRAELNKDIIIMKLEAVARLYKKTEPSHSWDSPDIGSSPEDLICADVHALARSANCAPLELDRLLFMCGSGNFGKTVKGKKIKTGRTL